MKPRSIDIAAIVSAVCERQNELADMPIIDVSVSELPESVEGDPALLDQVFTNLVSNAVKYSPDRPHITVTGRRAPADTVTIAIRDNGVGIPPDEQEKVFDRFFRAATSEGISGTGIGLNLALEFVQMHGGTIAVESVVGSGTTFTVTLPEKGASAGTEREPITSAGAAA